MSPPVVMGIIPARAGFTRRAVGGRRCPWDHPRSRGVYTRPSPLHSPEGRIIPARAGFTYRAADPSPSRLTSSPLARGLHGRRGHRAARLRIIPARAGFTRQPWRVSESSPDHPRSRGVYHRCWRLVCGRGGSSPLARGLRREGQESHQPLRIIPARAGFTVGDQDRSEEGVDHPRSRGVYNRP